MYYRLNRFEYATYTKFSFNKSDCNVHTVDILCNITTKSNYKSFTSAKIAENLSGTSDFFFFLWPAETRVYWNIRLF
jgi:hypothetical protein